jgi:hypothetical protein
MSIETKVKKSRKERERELRDDGFKKGGSSILLLS